MTILEAKRKYTIKVYITSKGDNLMKLVRMFYSSDAEIGYKTIRALNHRYDWADLPAGEEISYFPKDVLKNITEV